MSNSNLDKKRKLEETLILNRQMQDQLLVVKEKLEKLLSKVKDCYKLNDLLLKEGIIKRRQKGYGIKGAYLRGGTFYLKGNMFFKDINCRNCPNNPDYEKRKSENEMFPMDLNLISRHIWSTADKQGVIVGIKEQIIEYLSRSTKRKKDDIKTLDSEKLAKLLNMVPEDFPIDWNLIYSHNIHHRHSAKSCEAIWHLFLHPSLKRTVWSAEENCRLFEAAKKYNCQNWKAVAKEVGQRSEFQCFVQYQNYSHQIRKESHMKWTKEENQRLIEVVNRNNVNGHINWSNVKTYFPDKARSTLQTRINVSLNSSIAVGAPFTAEEDLLLIAAVKEYGNKFRCIPRNLFPNRSLTQLRSHYTTVLANRHVQKPWCLEDDIKLMDFVAEKGAKSWTECENYFEGTHSRTGCRTRFLVIKKHLEKYPNASIEDIPRKPKPNRPINITNWKDKVEEMSTNPEVVSYKTRKERLRGAPRKRRPKTYKKTEPQVNVCKKEPIEEQLQVEEIHKAQEEEKSVVVKEDPFEQNLLRIQATLQSMKGGQTTSEATPKIKRTRKKSNKRPYIGQLRKNGLKCYHFFKYAYNFQVTQHPCDNTQIRNENFTIAMASLRPQIPLPLELYKFDFSIPEHVKQKIKDGSLTLPRCEVPQLSPPSWSTAMGFRALCIQTACVSLQNPSEHRMDPIVESGHHISIFRERLRTLFYSTALLSRLNPAMFGITTTATTETAKSNSKRKRSLVNENEEVTNSKIKNIESVVDIKTEYEQ